MKKKIVVIIIFVSLLILPSIVWPFINQYDIEINENRTSASAPKFGDDFFQQFDKYFMDHAPFRNLSIKGSSYIEYQLEIFYQKLLALFGIEHYTVINDVLVGKNDWLFYTLDDSLSYYKGTNIPSEDILAEYVNRAERVNAYFKSQGKEFVIFIAPNKNEVYDEFMPSSIKVVNEQRRLDTIVNYFKAHSSVKVVYAKDSLIDAKESTQVYFKQDTHWNNAGGLVGCKTLFQELGMEFGNYNLVQVNKYGGDLANLSTLNPIKDVDFDTNYRPEIEMTKLYEGNDKERVVTHSNIGNGKNLLFLGDSFKYAMIDVLGKEFENSNFYTTGAFFQNSQYKELVSNASTVVFECVARYDNDIFGKNGLLQNFIDAYRIE